MSKRRPQNDDPYTAAIDSTTSLYGRLRMAAMENAFPIAMDGHPKTELRIPSRTLQLMPSVEPPPYTPEAIEDQITPVGISHEASGQESLMDLISNRPDMVHFTAAFKRIKNILRQSNFEGAPPVDEALLEPGPETELFQTVQQLRKEIEGVGYRPALEAIAGLRPRIDHFFDNVLVNAPDPQVRANRLAMLAMLAGLLTEFSGIAEMGSGAPVTVDADITVHPTQPEPTVLRYAMIIQECEPINGVDAGILIRFDRSRAFTFNGVAVDPAAKPDDDTDAPGC